MVTPTTTIAIGVHVRHLLERVLRHGRADEPDEQHDGSHDEPETPSFTSRSLDTLAEVLAANYRSGDDFVVEFLGHRFEFSSDDFAERVTAAAVRLELVASNDLRRGRGGRPRRARRRRPHRRAAQRARDLPRPALGARVARQAGVARVLAAQARLPGRLARPPGQGRPAGRVLGGRHRRFRLRGAEGRADAPRARAGSFVARAAVPRLSSTSSVEARLVSLDPMSLARARREADEPLGIRRRDLDRLHRADRDDHAARLLSLGRCGVIEKKPKPGSAAVAATR